jgi:hypothetical protein
MNSSTLLERWLLIQAINADPELSASAKRAKRALHAGVSSSVEEFMPPPRNGAASRT